MFLLRKHRIIMKYLYSFLIFSFVSVFSYSQALNDIKLEADSAFASEQYVKAIDLYKNTLEKTESADICYNLGCCYYRIDSIAQSILWFERAKLLDSGDEDIRFNLELARGKTIDKITPLHEIFFVSVYRDIVNMFNLHEWAAFSIAFFLIFLLGIMVCFFSNRSGFRKIGFSVAVLFLLLCVLGNVFAVQQNKYSENRKCGIILPAAVTVKSTPAENGNDLFVIHEGTKVEILDGSLSDWCEIKIADGKIGWILKNVMEVI